GYNWQSQRWVYGIETDFQWTGQDGDVSACFGTACAKASYELDWFGTLRGRVGYLLEPRSLLYLTGGFGYGHLSADFFASAPPFGGVAICGSSAGGGWGGGGGLGMGVEGGVDAESRISLYGPREHADQAWLDICAGSACRRGRSANHHCHRAHGFYRSGLPRWGELQVR